MVSVGWFHHWLPTLARSTRYCYRYPVRLTDYIVHSTSHPFVDNPPDSRLTLWLVRGLSVDPCNDRPLPTREASYANLPCIMVAVLPPVLATPCHRVFGEQPALLYSYLFLLTYSSFLLCSSPCFIALQGPNLDPSTYPETTLSSLIGEDRGTIRCNWPYFRAERRMAILRNRTSCKSPALLRAVPEDFPSHDMAPHHQSELDHDIVQVYQSYLRAQNYRNSASPPTPVEAYNPSTADSQLAVGSSSPDYKKVLTMTGLRETMGPYKHGNIQWRQSRGPLAGEQHESRPVDRRYRPKLQVAIPGAKDRPLPALPFFNTPGKSRVRSTLIEPEPSYAYDVSPPSATQRVVRSSVVSPLNQPDSRHIQQPVMPLGNFGLHPHIIPPRKNSPQSNSDSEGFHNSDSSSFRSKGSSDTSLEVEDDSQAHKMHRLPSTTYSPNQRSGTIPVIFQSPGPSPNMVADEFKPRRAPSSAPPRRYRHHPPIGQDVVFRPSCEAQSIRASRISRTSFYAHKASKQNTNQRKRSFDATQGAPSDPTRRPARQSTEPSRTLSEAVNDLEDTLISLAPETPTAETADREHEQSLPPTGDDQQDPQSHLGRASSEPLIPRLMVPQKSMPRRPTAPSNVFHVAKLPVTHIASQMTASHPRLSKINSLTLAIPKIPHLQRMTQDFDLSPIELVRPDIKRTITPGSAEAVIVGILRSLDCWDDLFATARVNWGFYRVYKRHELELIKSALYKMSPPAWEFREIAFPGHDLLHAEDLEMTRPEEEYTPMTYLRLQYNDEQVLRDIKTHILDKCQAFLRPEITVALMTNNPSESARVDNALWRIWTFCKIFGSGKGREEDIVAQTDWLKGGDIAHQKSGSGIMTTDYMNDTMIGASECFAKGNGEGLSAEQLFDMMELWNCLAVLLQGFAGRTADARQAGIFEPTHVRGGDIDGEHAMLDEWCHYLLTFGLSTILDLATPCQQSSSLAFELAAQKGLVNWNPPVFSGSRRRFLSEATSRIYEDKIANTYAELSSREVQRQQSKLRIQRHISELRHRRSHSDQGMESPVTDSDPVIGNLTRLPSIHAAANNVVTYIPCLRSANAGDLGSPITNLPASMLPPFPRLVAQPLLPSPPPSTVRSSSNRFSIATNMPSIEEHPANKRHKTVPEVPSLADHPLFRARTLNLPETSPHPSSSSQDENESQQTLSRQFSVSSVYSRSSSGNSPVHPTFQHSRQDSHGSLYSRSSSDSTTHPVFQQHPAQINIYRTESHENTADKAIYRIVEMGFTAEQARDALKATDLGDGLRVDAAVDLLLTGNL